MKKALNVSSAYKSMTLRALLSIVLFAIVYLLFVGLGVVLAGYCLYWAALIVSSHLAFITIIMGAGIASVGLLVMYSLLRFMFKTQKTDRSALIEITASEEPELFNMINSLVKEVETNAPKHVYLSHDVNACVFYDSGFWSMILPVKKNLQIGLGLVNSVTVNELKAVLAHEFGHFSQSTMKIGSYVYNCNQVIYNILFDENYHSLRNQLAELHGILALFGYISDFIVGFIRWVLKGMYSLINLSYMGLSREMEFNADEIAANVAGSSPLISSLLRMSFSDNAYQKVIGYYDYKMQDSYITQNLYSQQRFVMRFDAIKNNLSETNYFPVITQEDLNKYNKSKLVVKDQWASHPNTEDRIKALERINIIIENPDNRKAEVLFKNFKETSERVTNKLFSSVNYANPVINIDDDKFIEDYTTRYNETSFNELFGSYYDNKNPAEINADALLSEMEPVKSAHDLFNSNAEDKVYSLISLENDREFVQQVWNGTYKIKSFDYDGQRYKNNNLKTLIDDLSLEINELKDEIAKYDVRIYKYFYSLAEKQLKADTYQTLYHQFIEYGKEFEKLVDIYNNIVKNSTFISEQTPFEEIKKKIKVLRKEENKLAEALKKIVQDPSFEPELNEDIKKSFSLYLSNEEWEYFMGTKYDDAALNVLFTAVNNFYPTISNKYFRLKKELLNFMAELEKGS